jgi:hypothetical protein
MKDNQEHHVKVYRKHGLKRAFKKSKAWAVRRKTAVVVGIILVLAIGSSIYFYTKYQDTQNKLNHPELSANKTSSELVKKVSAHVLLPQGEQPTVAKVSDVSKLASQTFFAGAQNGDQVLIYAKAKKAILYRPSVDRVVNISSLNLNINQ